MMNGTHTPPATAGLEQQAYSGGEDRYQRILDILAVQVNVNNRAGFRGLFGSALNNPQETIRMGIIEPEEITFRQYQQLKVVKQEEERMLAISGEPRSSVMDFLNDYNEVLEVFDVLEQNYISLSILLHDTMPREAVALQLRILDCDLVAMHLTLEEFRQLLPINTMMP